MSKSIIISNGSYLPKKILTNKDLEKIVDTTDEWITKRTGITKRYIVEDELTSDLAFEAVKNAIAKTNKKEFCGIILATTTPDKTFPSTACIVQKKLSEIGIKTNFAFDIQAVCSGFVYATSIADSMIKSGSANSIIVIGADSLSKILDWKDRNTCVLFGDGAGAIILEKTNNPSRGIEYSEIHSDGSFADLLKTSGGAGETQTGGFIQMEGKEVFKHAVSKMSESIINISLKSNISLNKIDWIIPHQANERILDAVAKKLNIHVNKFVKTVDIHANTSAASIPLALDEIAKQGKLQEGDNIIFEALGGGLTWGGVCLKW